MVKTKRSNRQGDCRKCIVEGVEILRSRCDVRSTANPRHTSEGYSCFSRASPSSFILFDKALIYFPCCGVSKQALKPSSQSLKDDRIGNLNASFDPIFETRSTNICTP